MSATSRSISELRTPFCASFSQIRSEAGLEGAVTRTLAEGCLRRIAAMVCTRVVVLPVPGGPHSKSGGSFRQEASWRAAPRNFRCFSFKSGWGSTRLWGMPPVPIREQASSSMARCMVRSGVRLNVNLMVKGGRFWKELWKETLILSSSTSCVYPRKRPCLQVSRTPSPRKTLGRFSAKPGTKTVCKPPRKSSLSVTSRSYRDMSYFICSSSANKTAC
mmetsp:Transcript_4566/g.13479  ORF Transcript_4566/g.13479 Transcript_4566/m.13479 type:complete len:218 (-) Transcript_4566:549-1202(-)